MGFAAPLMVLELTPNTGLYGSRKVVNIKTMTYHDNKKARKLWSEQANAAKERKRLRETGEIARFRRIDEYNELTFS